MHFTHLPSGHLTYPVFGPQEVLVTEHTVLVQVKECHKVKDEFAALELGEGPAVPLTKKRHIAHDLTLADLQKDNFLHHQGLSQKRNSKKEPLNRQINCQNKFITYK